MGSTTQIELTRTGEDANRIPEHRLDTSTAPVSGDKLPGSPEGMTDYPESFSTIQDIIKDVEAGKLDVEYGWIAVAIRDRLIHPSYVDGVAFQPSSNEADYVQLQLVIRETMLARLSDERVGGSGSALAQLLEDVTDLSEFVDDTLVTGLAEEFTRKGIDFPPVWPDVSVANTTEGMPPWWAEELTDAEPARRENGTGVFVDIATRERKMRTIGGSAISTTATIDLRRAA